MATQALTLRDTTLGKKYVMALSGIVLFGFVIAHMIGNLQVFLGPKAINGYTESLHALPSLLWGARIVLVLAVVAHIVTALQLTALNRGARGPQGYKVKKDIATSYAAKAMPLTGIVLVAYIGYHIAHLTLGYTAGLGYEHAPPDVYSALINSFRVPWCAGLYLVAQLALGLHLYHGAWSLLQTLGINHKRYNDTLRSSAAALALTVVIGFMSIPVCILAGVIN